MARVYEDVIFLKFVMKFSTSMETFKIIVFYCGNCRKRRTLWENRIP